MTQKIDCLTPEFHVVMYANRWFDKLQETDHIADISHHIQIHGYYPNFNHKPKS